MLFIYRRNVELQKVKIRRKATNIAKINKRKTELKQDSSDDREVVIEDLYFKNHLKGFFAAV